MSLPAAEGAPETKGITGEASILILADPWRCRYYAKEISWQFH